MNNGNVIVLHIIKFMKCYHLEGKPYTLLTLMNSGLLITNHKLVSPFHLTCVLVVMFFHN